MGFVVFLLTLAVVYCLCEIDHIKKKLEPKQKVVKQDLVLKEQLISLKDKTCEITVKEPLIFIDIMYQAQGIILDVDQDWVLFAQTKNKKQLEKLIRIAMIKEVKEIIA